MEYFWGGIFGGNLGISLLNLLERKFMRLPVSYYYYCSRL